MQSCKRDVRDRYPQLGRRGGRGIQWLPPPCYNELPRSKLRGIKPPLADSHASPRFTVRKPLHLGAASRDDKRERTRCCRTHLFCPQCAAFASGFPRLLPSRRPARIGAWQRKTSGHNVPIAVRYRDGSTPMHTFGVSDTQRRRNASVLSQGKEYRAQCHRPWQASRTGLRRLEALLCLLIITAQLALVVAHSWEASSKREP